MKTNEHLKNLNLLHKIVEGSEYVGKARVAAALVYKGEIISFGSNSYKTHPFQKKYGRNSHSVHWHAETRTIFEASKNISAKIISKSTLYVCRLRFWFPEDDRLAWGIAKPCVGCMGAIHDFDIKEVVYTQDCPPGYKSFGTLLRN